MICSIPSVKQKTMVRLIHGEEMDFGLFQDITAADYTARKFGKQYDISEIDACFTTHIHHNRFHHSTDATHSWGIDLDDGSSNYEIHHNLILGIGIKLREGFDRVVHHNLLVGGQINIHVPYEEAKDYVYNNLILHSKPFEFVCSNKRFKASESVIKNNFIYMGKRKSKPHKFLKPQIVLKNYIPAGENDYNPSVPIDGWDTLESFTYGKNNCTFKSPAYYFDLKYDTKKFIKGVLCTKVTEAIRSSTASPNCDGSYVLKVFPFSTLKKAGVQQGDIILKINERPVEEYKKGKIQSVEYRREGKIYKFKGESI